MRILTEYEWEYYFGNTATHRNTNLILMGVLQEVLPKGQNQSKLMVY